MPIHINQERLDEVLSQALQRTVVSINLEVRIVLRDEHGAEVASIPPQTDPPHVFWIPIVNAQGPVTLRLDPSTFRITT